MFKRVFKILTVICLCAAAVFAAAGCDIGQKTYCTVTFDSLGGSKVPSQKIVSGGTAEKPQDPEKQDFIFDGWFTDTDCTEEYSFSNKVTKSFTLYAKWKQDELPVEPPEDIFFTVTFDANGHGIAPDPQTIKQGLTATRPAPLSEDGFTFGGWYKDSACTDEFDFSTPITADLTLYAKWTEVEIPVEPPEDIFFTVTFDANGHGVAPAPQTIKQGLTATQPAPLSEDGFTFGGWYKDSACTDEFDFSTPITADLTLYAKWTEVEIPVVPPEDIFYTVTFDSRGGSAVKKQYVKEETTAARPADPEREGFVFDGWYNAEDDEFDFSTPITADITLYAKWVEDTSETYFTVWFDSRGGNEIYARRVVSGSAVAPPADPVREGFTFAGWYSAEGEEFDFSKPVNSDLTLYAKWVEDTSETYFTVEFDSRGGNAVYAQEVISGGKAVKPADPVREGFTFTGWFTDEETKNAYDFNTTIDGDIKLYAGWIEN